MDAAVVQTVAQLVAQNGVQGVIAVDKHGLTLARKGTVNSDISGYIHSIGLRSKELALNGEGDPTVVLETESSKILIKAYQDMTIAIFKSPSS